MLQLYFIVPTGRPTCQVKQNLFSLNKLSIFKEEITYLFYRDVAVWENRRNGGTVRGDGRHDCLIRLLLHGAGHLEHQCKFRTPCAQSKLVAADNGLERLAESRNNFLSSVQDPDP